MQPPLAHNPFSSWRKSAKRSNECAQKDFFPFALTSGAHCALEPRSTCNSAPNTVKVPLKGVCGNLNWKFVKKYQSYLRPCGAKTCNMSNNEVFPNQIIIEEGSVCPLVDDPDQEVEQSPKWSIKVKVSCLTILATISLLVMMLLSEALIMRHLEVLDVTEETVKVDIVSLEDWSHKEAIQSDNVLSISALDGSFSLSGPKQLTEDKIFFSQEIENMIAPSPGGYITQDIKMKLRKSEVGVISDPDWLHCGRELNRLITLGDGSSACARNRGSDYEFVQGEVMSYYLSQVLGIGTTPVVVLSEVRFFSILFKPDFDFFLSSQRDIGDLKSRQEDSKIICSSFPSRLLRPNGKM